MIGSVKKRGKTYQYVVDVGINPFTSKRKQKTKGGYKRQNKEFNQCHKDSVLGTCDVGSKIADDGYNWLDMGRASVFLWKK